MPKSKPTVGQLSDRNAVLAAIAEYDRLGRDSFLAHHGFGRAKAWYVFHRGKPYDSKAILAVGLHNQLGVAVRPSHFRGGKMSVVRKLRALRFDVPGPKLDEEDARLPEEVPASYPEGLKRRVTVDRYERNAAAKRACIKAHGFRCVACGLEFGKRYGPEFEDLIHVHHLVPIARSKGRRRKVDPVKDLKPVCPNCHAAIHHAGKTRAIARIPAALSRQRRLLSNPALQLSRP